MKRITKASVDRTGNRYCGPLVLAALLGVSTAEAAAATREANDSTRAIKGMHNGELLRTLKAAGKTITPMDVPMRLVPDRGIGEPKGIVTHAYSSTYLPAKYGRNARTIVEDYQTQYCAMRRIGVTLAAWLRTRPDKRATYVINVTGHYVLVSGRKFVDTYTKGEWVNIGQAPHRRCRVEHVWQIT